MAIYWLQTLARSHPEVVNCHTVDILKNALTDGAFHHQTQAYFMYKEVANTLCAVIIHNKTVGKHALAALKTLLAETNGHPHRAAAEALGALPFSIDGPKIKNNPNEAIPSFTWAQFREAVGHPFTDAYQFIGRSLVTPLEQTGRLLVVKWARKDEAFENLHTEAMWMAYLKKQSGSFSVRFDTPTPLKIKGSYLFRLHDALPINVPAGLRLHKNHYAVSFVVDEDYFTYPNDTRKDKQMDDTAFEQVMARNAWLLGRLTSSGIVHAAPVPLFHNRVQRIRRRDQGRYEWPRAGRLDRWLESCRYPNLGLTGIRDFEHLQSFAGKSRILYRYIGMHLLSLLLITGSYFRNKDHTRAGFDKLGNPVDARDLFDQMFLTVLIYRIFCSYYAGFVCEAFEGDFPVDLDVLAARMIDEMGVDRYMEEILRAADQKQMSVQEFQRFLRIRGFSRKKISSLKKGVQDIIIYSGPHLGAFNHRISLPELIEAVGTMSSLCIAGRYFSVHQQ